MGRQEVSAFRGIQEVSAHRARKELLNKSLYLFASLLKVDYGWPFVNNAKIKKYIYSHSTKYICTQDIILHPETVYIFSFKEFYVFSFKEMIYLLTIREINSFKERIFIHKKCNQSMQLYSFTELYSFKGTHYQFIQGNVSSFKKIIFIQGNHIHSRKYIHLRNIYLFKFKAICSFK